MKKFRMMQIVAKNTSNVCLTFVFVCYVYAPSHVTLCNGCVRGTTKSSFNPNPKSAPLFSRVSYF